MLAGALAACDSSTEPGTPAAATIRLEPTDLALVVGESARLTARVEDEAGAPIQTDDIFWRSESDAVVSVSEDGTVTGVGPGSTRVAASFGGRSAVATIQVAVPRAEVAKNSAELYL